MLIFPTNKQRFKIPFYISSLLIIFFIFQKQLLPYKMLKKLYSIQREITFTYLFIKFKFVTRDFRNVSFLISTSFIINGLIFFFLSITEGYDKAYKDELTQIFGRRALNEEFNKLYGDYCISMVDIDHFKKFNDTYGHKAGDIVLFTVAQSFDRMSSGKVFRFGGEEFTIIHRNKDLNRVYKELENIRKYIGKNAIKIGTTKTDKKEKNIKVTVSIGISQKAEQQSTPQEVLQKADEYLYKAKKAGRNRVIADVEKKSKPGTGKKSKMVKGELKKGK